MSITKRADLNDPSISPVKKEYLERLAADKARSIAQAHQGEWAFLGLVGMNLQKLAAMQAPKQEQQPDPARESLYE